MKPTNPGWMGWLRSGVVLRGLGLLLALCAASLSAHANPPGKGNLGEVESCGILDIDFKLADGSKECFRNMVNLVTNDLEARKRILHNLGTSRYTSLAVMREAAGCPLTANFFSSNDSPTEASRQALERCQGRVDAALASRNTANTGQCRCSVLIENWASPMTRADYDRMREGVLKRAVGAAPTGPSPGPSAKPTAVPNTTPAAALPGSAATRPAQAPANPSPSAQVSLPPRAEARPPAAAPRTEPPPRTPVLMANRKALVIGNDNYASVKKLVNARADASAIGRALQDLGYRVTVKLDLSEKEMKSALRQFRAEIEGGDEVVFFFAGHGVQLGSANFLLPTDIRHESEEQVRDDALELQRILDGLNERRVKLALAIVDACRDNPFPREGRAIGGRGLAPTTAATGQMIVFSAGAGQQALDRLGPGDRDPNGLFTRTLLKEIRAPGVRVDNVIREVRKKVVEAARSVGHDQVPAIYDQVVGDFYFTR